MFGTGFITPLASIRRPWPGDTSADPKSAPSTAPPRSVPRMPRRALLAAGVVSTASVIIALAVRNPANAENLTDPRKVPEEVWAEKLSPLAYRVLRQSGTERAFTSELNKEKRAGKYECEACAKIGLATELFSSSSKFDSGTGWPSFFDASSNVEFVESGMDKILLQKECRCKVCGSHLGHVFKDGPRPTGLRHCINGVAVQFRPDSAKVTKSYPLSNVTDSGEFSSSTRDAVGGCPPFPL